MEMIIVIGFAYMPRVGIADVDSEKLAETARCFSFVNYIVRQLCRAFR